MDRIIKELKDLTFLNWSKIRESSGTAGSFLKSYMKYQNKKIYFKLSDYNNIDNDFGHECVNEIIIDRLLDILGVEHLKYYLINSKICLNDNIVETYLCASLDFKEKLENVVDFSSRNAADFAMSIVNDITRFRNAAAERQFNDFTVDHLRSALTFADKWTTLQDAISLRNPRASEKDLPVSFQSPVPGGCGLLTRLAVIENLISLSNQVK